MKHYIKYCIKGFKQNLSRFIAVIAIVALGVGILVGLLSSPTDLHESLDVLYQDNLTYDLNVKSTIGIHKDTVERLKTDNQIVQGVYMDEDKAYWNALSINARLISKDLENQEINRLTLVEGRFPTSSDECVVLEDNGVYSKLKVSDTFTYKNTTYKVVGIASSSEYYAKEQSFNLTATMRLDMIFYVSDAVQSYTSYTDLYIRYNSLESKSRFEDSYFNDLKVLEKQVESSSIDELELQKQSIRMEFMQTIEQEVLKDLTNQYGQSIASSMIKTSEVQTQIEELTTTAYENFLEENLPEWHILNLKSNLSYSGFSQNVDKINKIAVVFPIFFFFIAALVALTTITRLVEEERTSLGLLKSLGYSKKKICFKYVSYAFVCSFMGSIIGALLGIFILPYVIHIAFNTLYAMPKAKFVFHVFVNLLSCLLMVATIVFVALYVSLRTLKERPCRLLLPKAPRPGRRIFLEKIPVLWKRIQFKYKNMLRNIFRYKKNLFMMIIGVGGCVALLLCAFGIEEAIGSVGSTQYDTIFTYDLKVSMSTTELDYEKENTTIEYIETEDTHFTSDDTYDITKITASDFTEYIQFLESNGKPFSISLGDVILTKQLAKKFKLKLNSTFTLEGDKTEYRVSGICENYIGNYIYVVSNDFTPNGCFINAPEEQVDSIVEDLSSINTIKSIEVKRHIASSYTSMADSLTLVVLVIILCSGALAVIVIYNLTNININERIKEIATLKVLGYQRSEVCGYIYREVFVMSLLGILFGFILGPTLFSFIVYNLQSPGLMFSSYIPPLYYLYSFLITIVFVGIVDVLFIPKIKNVKMVESLKCVD